MKVLRSVSLMCFITFMACAISNWGNEFTKNPVVVAIGLCVSTILYAFGEAFTD